MIKFWVTRIKFNLAKLEDVPERYLDAVKKELGIE